MLISISITIICSTSYTYLCRQSVGNYSGKQGSIQDTYEIYQYPLSLPTRNHQARNGRADLYIYWGYDSRWFNQAIEQYYIQAIYQAVEDVRKHIRGLSMYIYIVIQRLH